MKSTQKSSALYIFCIIIFCKYVKILIQFSVLCLDNIVEGIFRRNGNEQQVKLLKQKIDQGELSLNNFIKEKTDGYVVASILKSFFREMKVKNDLTQNLKQHIYKSCSSFSFHFKNIRCLC